jgi:hypothetical protein
MTVVCRPLNSATYCSYCRSQSYPRPSCPEAPACHKCNSRAHPAIRCRRPPRPSAGSAPIQPAVSTQTMNSLFISPHCDLLHDVRCRADDNVTKLINILSKIGNDKVGDDSAVADFYDLLGQIHSMRSTACGSFPEDLLRPL